MDDFKTQSGIASWLYEADMGQDDLLSRFKAQVEQTTSSQDVPHAQSILHNVPVYDGEAVRKLAPDTKKRRALRAEWTDVLAKGAGVFAIRNGMDNIAVLDEATSIFSQIIEAEKSGAGGGGDHFAKAGANDRIWNALEKHCQANAHNFAHYYSNDTIAMAAEAWLGRGYQMTAQVNRVNPGGEAQKPHRDYHLGFMQADQTLAFPAHAHALSASLTLQGAIAHCDMPIESGPTQLLPFSQHLLEGYLAVGKPAFQTYFAEHYVQIPLQKGDMVFFNPALMHAAGSNISSDIYRMANLLQISSAFGRAMETVNRQKLCVLLYSVLAQAKSDHTLSDLAIRNVIAASAEGYSFPTNLDRDPPIGGLAPKTQAQFMQDGLAAGIPEAELSDQLEQLRLRQQS